MSFAEIQEMKVALTKKIQEDGKELFKAEIQKLFETIPQLEDIRWIQYTPYFQDGDPCVFGVNDPYFKVGGAIGAYPKYEKGKRVEPIEFEYKLEGESGDYNDNRFNASGFKGYIENSNYFRVKSDLTLPQAEALKDFASLICNNEDVMKLVFGDHAEVIVNREGFEVERYDHD